MCTRYNEFKLDSKGQRWKKRLNKGGLLRGLRPTADYDVGLYSAIVIECGLLPHPIQSLFCLLSFLHNTHVQTLLTGFLKAGHRQEHYSLRCSLQETSLWHDCEEGKTGLKPSICPPLGLRFLVNAA